MTSWKNIYRTDPRGCLQIGLIFRKNGIFILPEGRKKMRRSVDWGEREKGGK